MDGQSHHIFFCQTQCKSSLLHTAQKYCRCSTNELKNTYYDDKQKIPKFVFLGTIFKAFIDLCCINTLNFIDKVPLWKRLKQNDRGASSSYKITMNIDTKEEDRLSSSFYILFLYILYIILDIRYYTYIISKYCLK